MADFEKITRKRLGEILVAEGLVTQEQVAEALQAQERTGEMLVAEGLVTQEQVAEALQAQERTGEMLGEALIKAGYITESDIAKTLCYQFQRPFIKAAAYDIPKEILALIPPRLMIEHLFVPLDRFGNLLVLVMAGLLDKPTIQQVQKLTSCDVEIYIGTVSDVKKTLRTLLPDYFDPITLEPRLGARPAGKRETAPAETVVAQAGKPARAPGEVTSETMVGAQPAARREQGGDTAEVIRVGADTITGTPPDPAKRQRDLEIKEIKPILAEDDSDWEALFEEAEKEVMKDLREKGRG